MEEIGLLALGSRPARQGLVGRVARGPPRDPVGVRLDAGPRRPRRLVRPGHRSAGRRRRGAPPRGVPRVAAAAHHGRQRGDEPREDRRAHHPPALALGDRDDLADLVLEELALTASGSCASPAATGCCRTSRSCSVPCSCAAPYVDALSLLQLRALRALRAIGHRLRSRRGAAPPAAAVGQRRRGRASRTPGERHPRVRVKVLTSGRPLE